MRPPKVKKPKVRFRFEKRRCAGATRWAAYHKDTYLGLLEKPDSPAEGQVDLDRRWVIVADASGAAQSVWRGRTYDTLNAAAMELYRAVPKNDAHNRE